MIKQLICVLCLFFTIQAHAWWDQGHRVVSELAYQELTPEAKKSVDKIVRVFHSCHPSYQTLGDLSLWPDYLQPEEKDFAFNQLHFITIAYDPEGILSEEQKQSLEASVYGTGLLISLDRAKAVLRSKKTDSFSKCWALAYLTHVVADIHQPMHCCTLYSKRFPKGDFGGNRYPVKPSEGSYARNMHQLWDSGVGLLVGIRRDARTGSAQIQDFIAGLKKEFPKENLSLINSMDPKVWSEESHNIAVEHVYTLKPNQAPTEEYVQVSQEIVKERLSLAGYRLASILNEVFSSQELMKTDSKR